MRWRLVLLAGWLAATVAGAAFGGQIFDRAAVVDELGPTVESMRAKQQLAELDPQGPLLIAVTKDRDPYDPALVASAATVNKALHAIAGVAKVDDLYSGLGGKIGEDNRSTLVLVELSRDLDDAAQAQAEQAVVAELRRLDAPTVLVGGPALAEREFADRAVADAAFGESAALVVLAVLLLLLFRQLVPALSVLGTALAVIAVTLLVLRGLAELTTVSEYAVNVVTLLGLGLSVDYALLLLWRYREQLALGDEPAQALSTAVARAGRAVLVSGAAVAVALAGLMIFAEPLLAAMALGGVVAVMVATLAALTLVPALIAVGFGRIGPARERRGRGSLMGRLAAWSVRRPGPVAFGAVAGLLLLAVPFIHANLGNSEVRALPVSSEVRQVAQEVQDNFQQGRAAPVEVVVASAAGGTAMRDYLNELNNLPNVDRLELRFGVPEGNTVIDLTPPGETAGGPSQELVRAVRRLAAPAPVLVGGPAAEVVDYAASVRSRLPIVLAVLFIAMLVLLYLLTGSVVIAVKALLLNALSLLAALGVLVVVFQWGWGAGPLGFTGWGGIDLTTPVLLFVFIFGLSMDYEVFLLARITEEWRASGDNDQAIVAGISRTGPVVTAAAACLVVVFAGFVLGDLVPVKEIGVGMVAALILDVTVVRGLLLPASMALLGRWNWWPGPIVTITSRNTRQRPDAGLPPMTEGA